ncbi:PREDICTED: glucan endo-1,3-beta-glucosidase 7-like [Erythranthe guttata]|uniref:glucan endo-1,3-beta-glucosidase 7-like n=1 Tax=Erythranthe guttata TaxID=4155 RepID=UPI00064DE3B0|nr:PREDICTED: glucan endo-1,3-beta-glucosidase 7-like [Erythranthe guttata]|eukprot:XP_012844508.1 PREDICTED: glucan endo-1,3-beta-glucosidase 7-like [Erythranthe guttata]
MEKINISLFLICFIVGVAHSEPIGDKQADHWCIARPKIPNEKLQAFIDYACGIIDCAAIQPGGPCYNPNPGLDPGDNAQLLAHADYALNQFYRSKYVCNTDVGFLITFDPSYGNCKFQ